MTPHLPRTPLLHLVEWTDDFGCFPAFYSY
jgi:hypothetical protein